MPMGHIKVIGIEWFAIRMCSYAPSESERLCSHNQQTACAHKAHCSCRGRSLQWLLNGTWWWCVDARDSTAVTARRCGAWTRRLGFSRWRSLTTTPVLCLEPRRHGWRTLNLLAETLSGASPSSNSLDDRSPYFSSLCCHCWSSSSLFLPGHAPVYR